MIESGDLIRRRARELGFTDRQVLEMAGNADWSQLPDAAASIGMFDERKLLEVRLPGGKPGVKGAKAIIEFLSSPVEGVVTVFTLPRPDWQGVKASWWKELAQKCTVVDCDPIERRDLPAWLAARLAQNGQSAPREALEAFADLVEGNLLAAKQEIGKPSPSARAHARGDPKRGRELLALLGRIARRERLPRQPRARGADRRRTRGAGRGVSAPAHGLHDAAEKPHQAAHGPGPGRQLRQGRLRHARDQGGRAAAHGAQARRGPLRVRRHRPHHEGPFCHGPRQRPVGGVEERLPLSRPGAVRPACAKPRARTEALRACGRRMAGPTSGGPAVSFAFSASRPQPERPRPNTDEEMPS